MSTANPQPSLSAQPSRASIPGASSTGSSSSNALYTHASRVPLIKSPSISLPPPVKLPQDLHPLPSDISAYFVYPFSLESYVLDPNTPSSSTIDQLLAKHKQYLEGREREKEEKQREMLRRVAPGWQQGDVLLPTSSKASGAGPGAGPSATAAAATAEQQESRKKDEKEERTPLDDLADHLAQLDALNAGAAPTGPQHQLP